MDTIEIIPGVILTPLKKIPGNDGAVFQGLKAIEASYFGFGEAYFSFVSYNAIKPWKRHKKMTLNLIVPIGKIRFVLFDDRHGEENNQFMNVVLSPENYQRLTVPPMVWVAFRGESEMTPNMLLNVSDLVHDPGEVDRIDLADIYYKWDKPG